MMITKFNKLIRNKVLWGIFAILMSLALVGLFSPSSNSKENDNSNEAGTLFGEPVSRTEFNRARLFAQAFRTERNTDPIMQERINEDTWRRLAILKLADKMGISVTDQELSSTIQQDPTFAVNGAFNPMRYKQLIEQQMRIRVSTFEAYLREELLLQKMGMQAGQSLWISPYELNRSVSRLTDLFTIQIARIGYSNAVSNVEASEEEIQSFYNDHKDIFEIPERRSVKYAAWPITNYLASVSIPEEDISDYYDIHMEDYAVSDTNEVVSYTPLEEVADEIRHELANHQAIILATEDAMQFTDALLDVGYEDDVSFMSVASKQSINVYTSALFQANGSVPDLNVGANFLEAAFRLNPEIPEDSFSHTIVGDDAIYVIAIHSIEPPFTPPLENVKEKAAEFANDMAKSTAFHEKSKAVREDLLAAVKSGEAFDKAAKGIDLTLSSPDPFSVYEATEETLPDYSSIAPAVLELSKNELSEPIQTPDGAALVYVIDRQPGDIALAESLKPEIARTIQSTRMRVHFNEWADQVLADARGNTTPVDPETYE